MKPQILQNDIRELNYQRFIFSLAACVGQEVSVQLQNETCIKGVFNSAQSCASPNWSVILQNAHKLPNETALSSEIEDVKVVELKNMLYMTSAPCSATFEETAVTEETGFRIDAEIAARNQPDNLSRDLERWEPTEKAPFFLQHGLEDQPGSTNTSWDQFEANSRVFHVKSTYKEDMYTTPLDMAAIPKSVRDAADQIAREIESSHKGPSSDAEADDEETKYAAVARPGETPPSDKNPTSPSKSSIPPKKSFKPDKEAILKYFMESSYKNHMSGSKMARANWLLRNAKLSRPIYTKNCFRQILLQTRMLHQQSTVKSINALNLEPAIVKFNDYEGGDHSASGKDASGGHHALPNIDREQEKKRFLDDLKVINEHMKRIDWKTVQAYRQRSLASRNKSEFFRRQELADSKQQDVNKQQDSSKQRSVVVGTFSCFDKAPSYREPIDQILLNNMLHQVARENPATVRPVWNAAVPAHIPRLAFYNEVLGEDAMTNVSGLNCFASQQRIMDKAPQGSSVQTSRRKNHNSQGAYQNTYEHPVAVEYPQDLNGYESMMILPAGAAIPQYPQPQYQQMLNGAQAYLKTVGQPSQYMRAYYSTNCHGSSPATLEYMFQAPPPPGGQYYMPADQMQNPYSSLNKMNLGANINGSMPPQPSPNGMNEEYHASANNREGYLEESSMNLGLTAMQSSLYNTSTNEESLEGNQKPASGQPNPPPTGPPPPPPTGPPPPPPMLSNFQQVSTMPNHGQNLPQTPGKLQQNNSIRHPQPYVTPAGSVAQPNIVFIPQNALIMPQQNAGSKMSHGNMQPPGQYFATSAPMNPNSSIQWHFVTQPSGTPGLPPTGKHPGPMQTFRPLAPTGTAEDQSSNMPSSSVNLPHNAASKGGNSNNSTELKPVIMYESTNNPNEDSASTSTSHHQPIIATPMSGSNCGMYTQAPPLAYATASGYVPHGGSSSMPPPYQSLYAKTSGQPLMAAGLPIGNQQQFVTHMSAAQYINPQQFAMTPGNAQGSGNVISMPIYPHSTYITTASPPTMQHNQKVGYSSMPQ